MKTMKVALLATAALAAVSASARADEAAAIKAQLEALTARIAQLEAAPAVPVGYSLLTISEGQATIVPFTSKKEVTSEIATIIGIMPTADMPASATVEWSGYVRTGLGMYNDDNYSSEDDVYLRGRGQLTVTGKTETAVGEVGATMTLRSNFYGTSTNDVYMSNAWGWWQMTPELQFGGGYTGSLSNVGYGLDEQWSSYHMDSSDAADLNPGDTTQLRLSYVSGPMSVAVAVEGAENENNDDLGVAGKVKWAGDTVSGEISAGWRDDGSSGQVDPWQVGAGMGFDLGSMVALGIGAAMGTTDYNYDYWAVSGFAMFTLTEEFRAEIGAAMKEYDSTCGTDCDQWTVGGGLYYNPVSQLELGVIAEIVETDGTGYGDDYSNVAFVTKWSF